MHFTMIDQISTYTAKHRPTSGIYSLSRTIFPPKPIFKYHLNTYFKSGTSLSTCLRPPPPLKVWIKNFNSKNLDWRSAETPPPPGLDGFQI